MSRARSWILWTDIAKWLGYGVGVKSQQLSWRLKKSTIILLKCLPSLLPVKCSLTPLTFIWNNDLDQHLILLSICSTLYNRLVVNVTDKVQYLDTTSKLTVNLMDVFSRPYRCVFCVDVVFSFLSYFQTLQLSYWINS